MRNNFKNNTKGEDYTMLKITKVVSQDIANMSGCGKLSDYSCGIRARQG